MAKRRNIPGDFFAREYSRNVIMNAEPNNQRTGQYLFNSLPTEELRRKVVGTTWDPFYKDLSQYELVKWLGDHIIFNSTGKIVGLFDKNEMLWEDKHA